jgi:hypothetical protein
MFKRMLLPLFIIIVFSITIDSQKISADPVYKYNTTNAKYHQLDCKWAIKCTKNCVEKKLSEIRKLGGIPCKTCKPQE